MLKLRSSAAALLLVLFAAPAAAHEYTLMIYETPEELALRDDPGPRGSAYWSGYAVIGAELAQAGILRGGAALSPVDVVSLEVRGDAPRVSNPAAGDGRERLGGYFIIAVPDIATARAWAAKIPSARTGRIEIRSHAATRTGM